MMEMYAGSFVYRQESIALLHSLDESWHLIGQFGECDERVENVKSLGSADRPIKSAKYFGIERYQKRSTGTSLEYGGTLIHHLGDPASDSACVRPVLNSAIAEYLHAR